MKTTTLAFALSLCLLCPGAAGAQKNLLQSTKKLGSLAWKQVLPSRSKAAAESFAIKGLSPQASWQISRRLMQDVQLKKSLLGSASLSPMEQHIRHFIFTVSSRDITAPFKGSGFVFAEHHNGQTTLWGFSAAHVVRHMGEEVKVTFYADGKEYTYPARVVSTGRKYGLNAALIQLPPQAAEVARPVMPAPLPSAGDALFTYGFSAGTYKKTIRRVLTSNEERIVADFPRLNMPKPGFCGSVVLNEQGQAVGIEVGGYSPAKEHQQWYDTRRQWQNLPRTDLSRISEVLPFDRAYDLIRHYRNENSADRVMLFNGIWVGRLATDEFVEEILVRYQDGSFRQLMRNPFMALSALDAPFPLENAVEAEIFINKGRTQAYSVLIDLRNREVIKRKM